MKQIPAKQHKKNVLKEVWKNRSGYFFVLPHFVLFAVFFLVPVGWGMYLSMFRHNVFSQTFVWFDNYKRILSDWLFLKALKNTFVYTFGVVPLWLGKALLVTVLIYPFRKSIQTFFKAAFYLPHVTSSVIISMIWLWVFNPNFGLLNYFMTRLGLDPVIWLGRSLTAMPSLIIMQVIMGGGSTIVLLSAAMASIPEYYFEAATLEGASSWAIFRKITIPLLKPTILYALVMGTIANFQTFSNIYIMTKGGPEFSTTTIAYLIYETAFKSYNLGLASAMSMVMFVILVVLGIIQFKWLGSNVEY
ncbi:MAG TPA: sugar ABC transporter permease [Mesotoga infera]|uniref:Permease component of ABC-type sugar transporter n=1 Tax=Mesotoga infera TaxID=1236046 RepID=A0A7Z7LH47_9BACT|nr:sugar ABC transporter permease [Mesotoga infera]NLI05708.1 sugar ABC transporter permease [Thermotogaceae bacterium]HRR44660.1 sugar ABC transporter permease [Mesotoga sp.]SSC14029.1 Permease component of ABC-type sugar transporter [Mesotoga infera]HNS68144.1 sugar ABC transporter permease [Mesotoga infera]HOI33706.1 sugar ABC transporter permease [Mesotoga infera]